MLCICVVECIILGAQGCVSVHKRLYPITKGKGTLSSPSAAFTIQTSRKGQIQVFTTHVKLHFSHLNGNIFHIVSTERSS